MPAPAQDKNKKKLPAAAKAKDPKAAGPAVAGDKAALGAMMRPEKGGALEVGAASDKAEKEADAVADAVVKDAPAEAPEAAAKDAKKDEAEDSAPRETSIRGPPAGPPASNIIPFALSRARPGTALVQREAAPDSQPNLDELSATPALPGNMSDVSVSGREETQLGGIVDDDWTALGKSEGLQARRAAGTATGSFTVEPSVAARIQVPTDAGSPLPPALRQRMEARLGVDLGTVRVHTGTEPESLCRHIGARAFAHGAHVWLRSPADRGDTRLMAHEIAHTVQQGAAPRRASPRHGRPSDTRSPVQPRAPPAAPQPANDTASTAAVRRANDGDDGWLARGAESVADRLDSYGVLKVVIGRRLFTGATVNASAIDFVGAFMKFLGAEETFEQMKQSGSLEKGFAEIKQGLTTYDLTWDRVGRMFDRAYDDFDWWSPIDSFKRIFLPFFSDLASYGLLVLKIIAKLVAEAFVISFGPMGRAVWEKMVAIGENIALIVADPLGFALNLIKAIGRGIAGFGERIWDHIKSGLLAWILGPFAAMGVKLPEKLDLAGIVSVILQVLGLTYDQLRPRIVRAMNPNGDIKVTVVERIIEAVNILRTEGLAGIWRKLMEWVENMQMTVINGIRDWVVRAIVQAGIRKLVAWSNPAGALLDILLTIYNLIVFFVERFQQILDFASSVFDSIGKIARGQLADAAKAVEASLAMTIPIILSFMARLLSLPDITGTVRKIVTNLRAKVHAAFDKALDWIIAKVKKLITKMVSKFRKATPPGRVPFTLAGTPHEMWVSLKGGKVDIRMASEDEKEVTAAKLAESAKAIRDSDEVFDAAALSQAEQAEAAARTLEAEEAKINRKPQTNREAPQTEKALTALIEKVVPPLSEAAKKPANAPEPPQNVDPAKTPEDGEGATDRTDLPFRHVIRNTEPVEGTAGTWAQASVKWEAAKASAGDKADVYANFARDHAPEFALLARLAKVRVPGVLRDGSPAPDPVPLFPDLARNVPVPDTAKKEQNPELPVMVIRTRINSTLNINDSALYSGWDTMFDQDGEHWKPKAVDAAPTQEALIAGLTALGTSHGATGVIADMRTHFDAVKKAYAALPPGTVTDTFVDGHLEGRAKPALDQITARIFGQPGPAAEVVEGVGGDINIPYEQEMVDGELTVARYSKLGTLGGYMERHHMVENSIMESFKAEMLKDDYKDLAALLGDASTRAETVVSAAENALSKENAEALAKSPDAAAARGAAVNALNESFAAQRLNTGFDTQRGPATGGIAVMVLNTVNQNAGSQPEGDFSGPMTAIKAAQQDKAGKAAAGSLKAPVTAALEGVAGGAPFDAGAFRSTVDGVLSGVATPVSTELPGALKGLLKDLTDGAYDRFEPLQKASIAKVEAGSPGVKARAAPMIARFAAEASRPELVKANAENWFP